MTGNEIREKFLEFFKARGHAVVPSSSLVPDDPSVLLTTAGMQQFKRYYTGELDAEKDFGSKNTVSIQKSFRTSDIDEVGDDSHLTFFEMLGNFSFGGPSPRRSGLRPREGGYFKREAIEYAYEFITQELGLKIDYVSVFEGDSEVPPDKESEEIWESFGITKIKKAGRTDNFWGPTGSEGPCGPTAEIYINDTEIWNIVFNEYYMRPDKTLEPLKQKGVDTGMGLERLAMVSQKVLTIFETDLFSSMIAEMPEGVPVVTKRVLADHLRGIVFLISDGVHPSNKEAGYVLRRLMRRAIFHINRYGVNYNAVFESIFRDYGKFYKELNKEPVLAEFSAEKEKFEKTLNTGEKEIMRLDHIDAGAAFKISSSYGVPYELIKEIGGEKTADLKREDFEVLMDRHREISRAGTEKKFGGHGLLLNTGELKAGDEEELKKVTRLHAATHLLQQALREVLGSDVRQAGSDITAERTRFDFTFSRKMTPEEIKKVEDRVNEVVAQNLPVQYIELPKDEAIKTGALFYFKEKYPAYVKIYYIGPSLEEAWSKEFCGGPHVKRTSEIGRIKILKEESVSSGVRRIRATVEETLVSGIVAGKGSGKR